MNTKTELLKSIAENIVARQKTNGIDEQNEDHRLLIVANELERSVITTLRAFDNFPQRDTFRNDIIGRLVDICDILYEGHGRISPDTKILLNLLTNIKKILPNEISPLLRLPKAFVQLQQEAYKEVWTQYEAQFRQRDIDAKLIAISSIPFKRFIDGNVKLFWGDFTWLKGYAAKLDAIDWDNADCNSNTEALMSLLIGKDFNHEQFYTYCKRYIQARVALGNSKERRLQELAICEKLVIEDTQIGLPSFDRYANTVSDRLVKWIKEEITALKAGRTEDYIGKLTVIWNVDTLAPFIKLLWDHKLFKETTLEVLSKQVAAGFSSNTKGDFQGKTVYSRFYNTDAEIMAVLEAFLTELLEDVRRFT